MFFFSLSKVYDAQPFLGCVLLTTKLSFCIIFPLFSISCTHTCSLHHWRDYDEQKAVIVLRASLPGLLIKMHNVLVHEIIPEA